MNRVEPLMAPISPGELWDKVTILRIKAQRIADATKNATVRAELAALEAIARGIPDSGDLDALVAKLHAVNECLWNVEDAIRRHENANDFGREFVALARSVYRRNDERAHIKRQINHLLGAAIFEQKQYAAYS